MGIVEIVGVTVMPNGYVTATGSVDMGMREVTVGHGKLSI
ncbi:hypothetical protein HYPP_02703 [Hyphomicrobium sp. ghe19]|nr:hypothetical protein HYPP_02703 [Hyphomicrobium sp. ghe19]